MDRNQFTKSCTFKRGSWNCGSYQFNLQKNHIDQGDLCDVHFWQTQAQRPWVGLTDEEISVIVREAAKGSAIRRDGSTSVRIARAIETKLREKNGG